MARREAMNFYEIEVVLVSGAYLPGDWSPGRVFAVPGNSTLARLAEAIDHSLGRWDLGHEREFTIEGRSARGGTRLEALGLAQDAEFEYEFDLGDSWIHRCRVRFKGPALPDDEDWKPTEPIAIEGWGNMPDQYGVVAMTDDGPLAQEPEPERK